MVFMKIKSKPLVCCALACHLLKGELSKPIKMQTTDRQCAVEMGQGEMLNVKYFLQDLIHHVRRKEIL